jgi:hypothetical protein
VTRSPGDMPGRYFEGRWVEWVGRDASPRGKALCPVCEEHFTVDDWEGNFRLVPRRELDGTTFYDAVATCSLHCQLR